MASSRAALLSALSLSLVACGPDAQPLPAKRPVSVVSRAEALRPTDTAAQQMWHFDSTETVQHADSPDGGFRVHFTRAGRNAVPSGDGDFDGTPDFVELVERVYDDVGTLYATGLGFRRPPGDGALPDNGGDGRYDVYLVDFGLQADGAMRVDSCTSANRDICVSYVAQENDFTGYGYPSLETATKILGSHEYFHAVQAAYDNAQNVVISEGTAVWATEHYDPASDDFEGFVNGYLDRPERSLDTPPPGPVPEFAYGSAIFFEYLSERFGDDIVRKLWEHLENGHGFSSEPANQSNPTWLVQLDALLKADYGSSFAEAFREFATWNLYLATAANPAKSYQRGADYPPVAMTSAMAPYQVSPMRVFYASTQYLRFAPDGRAAMTAQLIDDPATAENETTGLALVLATRQGPLNAAVVTLTDATAGAQTLDTNGASTFIVAVINTDREQHGTAASRRPGLCVGTVEEVARCHDALMPPPPDAGAPEPADAGVEPTDAGASSSPPPPVGCHCQQTSLSGPLALAAVAFIRARRRPS